MMWTFVPLPFSYCITNSVGCRPTAEDFKGRIINREPTPEEQEACRPRIDQLVASHNFDGIVYLGKHGATYKTKEIPLSRTLSLLHPAAILRMEYKLHSVKLEALKLTEYIDAINQAKTRTSGLHRKPTAKGP